jgi:hypothetical protein
MSKSPEFVTAALNARHNWSTAHELTKLRYSLAAKVYDDSAQTYFDKIRELRGLPSFDAAVRKAKYPWYGFIRALIDG